MLATRCRIEDSLASHKVSQLKQMLAFVTLCALCAALCDGMA